MYSAPTRSMSVRTTPAAADRRDHWRCGRPAGRHGPHRTTVFNDIFGSPLFDFLHADEEPRHLFTSVSPTCQHRAGPIANGLRFPETPDHRRRRWPRRFLARCCVASPNCTASCSTSRKSLTRTGSTPPWPELGAASGDFFRRCRTRGTSTFLKRVLHDWTTSTACAS